MRRSMTQKAQFVTVFSILFCKANSIFHFSQMLKDFCVPTYLGIAQKKPSFRTNRLTQCATP
jgi:hypothetical protein